MLLIACANVANLQLARGSARQRELVVRAALGAGRRRLVRQLLTESVLLAGLGGALGVVLAVGLLGVIAATLPPYTLPSEADVRLSVPVLLFSLLATTLAGVVFGCAPAWQATRLGLADSLKQGGRSATDPGRNRLHHALVVVEFALALSLLTGGGLAVHSLLRLTRTDLGFPTERLLTFSLPVPSSRLADHDAVRGFYRRLLERIEALPGVTSATVSTGMPVEGTRFGMPFEIVGQPVAEGAERQGAGFNMATPAYFRTFGMRIVRGRAFGEDDREQRATGGRRQRDLRAALPRGPRSARAAPARAVPGRGPAGRGDERRVADRGRLARRQERRAPAGGVPRDRRALLAEPLALGAGHRAQRRPAGDAGRGPDGDRAGRRTPSSRWPTSAPWTRW